MIAPPLTGPSFASSGAKNNDRAAFDGFAYRLRRREEQ